MIIGVMYSGSMMSRHIRMIKARAPTRNNRPNTRVAACVESLYLSKNTCRSIYTTEYQSESYGILEGISCKTKLLF